MLDDAIGQLASLKNATHPSLITSSQDFSPMEFLNTSVEDSDDSTYSEQESHSFVEMIKDIYKEPSDEINSIVVVIPSSTKDNSEPIATRTSVSETIVESLIQLKEANKFRPTCPEPRLQEKQTSPILPDKELQISSNLLDGIEKDLTLSPADTNQLKRGVV